MVKSSTEKLPLLPAESSFDETASELGDSLWIDSKESLKRAETPAQAFEKKRRQAMDLIDGENESLLRCELDAWWSSTKTVILRRRVNYRRLLKTIEGTIRNPETEGACMDEIVSILKASVKILEKYEQRTFLVFQRSTVIEDWMLNLHFIEIQQLVERIREQRGLPTEFSQYEPTRQLQEVMSKRRLKSSELRFPTTRSVIKKDFQLVSVGTYAGRAVNIVATSGYDRAKYVSEGILCWSAAAAKTSSEKYIAQFIGLLNSNDFTTTITPCSAYGNLATYLEGQKQIDHTQIILHLADGLKFLHSLEPPISLGWINTSRILVDDYGRPLFADFILAQREGKANDRKVPDRIDYETARWLAPELYASTGTTSKVTLKSDVYSFAMTVLEIVTGKVPFSHLSGYAVSLYAGHFGSDARQQGVSIPLWALLVSCWRKNPDSRPYMGSVASDLRKPDMFVNSDDPDRDHTCLLGKSGYYAFPL